MEKYYVRPLHGTTPLSVEVPGSKSITNRALMLAALGNKRCCLKGVLFSDDSRAFLSCLKELGFDVEIDEGKKQVTIQGLGGQIPNRKASIHVRSAGTAARFLTVMLAFAGGDYRLDSSQQMKKRPMEPLISELRKAGVTITCLEEEGHFPFLIQSESPAVEEIAIDTNISSQFASALLMAATLLPQGLKVRMLGERSEGSYVKMTLAMLEQFGISCDRDGKVCVVGKAQCYGLEEYEIEPDMSAACYFYAMAAVLGRSFTVCGTHENSLQGDKKFLDVLRQLGCHVEDDAKGITVTGTGHYPGMTINMKDFSDQTMTMAVVAAFADSPTRIEDVGHIRMQESDRICAIVTELNRMGVKCREVPECDGIEIIPAPVHPAEIETYEDHRVAMAFAIAGMRADGIVICNPMCCAKTFENYFEVVDNLYTE